MYCKKCGIKQEEGAKFCSSCGTGYHYVDNNSLKDRPKGSGRRTLFKILLSLLSPVIVIFITVALWGVVSIISETMGGMSTLVNILNAIIPIIIGISVLAIPVGIVFAIYFYINKD